MGIDEAACCLGVLRCSVWGFKITGLRVILGMTVVPVLVTCIALAAYLRKQSRTTVPIAPSHALPCSACGHVPHLRHSSALIVVAPWIAYRNRTRATATSFTLRTLHCYVTPLAEDQNEPLYSILDSNHHRFFSRLRREGETKEYRLFRWKQREKFKREQKSKRSPLNLVNHIHRPQPKRLICDHDSQNAERYAEERRESQNACVWQR